MRKLRVCGRTVEQYGGFALTCNSKDAESPCVFARASKFANAFIRENSAAFDDLQVAIDEALGALIEDSLGASGLSLKTKRVKEWAFAYAEAHSFFAEANAVVRTCALRRRHGPASHGAPCGVVSTVVGCRHARTPSQLCAAALHGDGLLDDYERVRTLGLHPLQTTCLWHQLRSRAISQRATDGPVQCCSDAMPARSPFPKHDTYG